MLLGDGAASEAIRNEESVCFVSTLQPFSVQEHVQTVKCRPQRAQQHEQQQL
jgi:hypothetical protein